MATVQDYVSLLQNLLPPGIAWNREAGSNLTNVLTGVATELLRVHERTEALIREANPLTMVEMLPARYTEAGLPDDCAGEPDSIEAKRREIIARWAGRGRQTPQYFIHVMAKLGVEIQITEYRACTVDDFSVGDPIYSDDWVHYWTVTAADAAYKHFAVGVSTAGDPLQQWGETHVQCALERTKPAHTTILYNFVTSL